MCSSLAVPSFKLAPNPASNQKNYKTCVYPWYLGFIVISSLLSFKILSEIVLLANYLLSEYEASW